MRSAKLSAKLHAMEKHLRKHTLHVPFSTRLQATPRAAATIGPGRAGGQPTAQQEAHRLAVYIFFNCKPSLTRCVPDASRPDTLRLACRGLPCTSTAGTQLLRLAPLGCRDHIVPADLEALMSKSQAAEAFGMLDTEHAGRVTLPALKAAVSAIYTERGSLAAQLKDSKSIVGALEFVLGLVLHVVVLFSCLLVFSVRPLCPPILGTTHLCPMRCDACLNVSSCLSAVGNPLGARLGMMWVGAGGHHTRVGAVQFRFPGLQLHFWCAALLFFGVLPASPAACTGGPAAAAAPDSNPAHALLARRRQHQERL